MGGKLRINVVFATVLNTILIAALHINAYYVAKYSTHKMIM